MAFKLTSQIVDNIIFGMENQGEEYVFDLEECQVVLKGDVEELSEDRYTVIPEWGPAQGFQLMEQFVGTLRNPIYRELLKNALLSGRGVFRKFKDVLKEREDIERLWFNFKEKELRKRVVQWYEQTCECLGLENLGVEPEETEDLILSDFMIQTPSEEDLPLLETMDREAFSDMFPEEPEEFVQAMYRKRRIEVQIGREVPHHVLCVRTPEGEIVGFVWGRDAEFPGREGRAVSTILQIYIASPFRGLGLAKLLLDRYLTDAESRKIDRIYIELAGDALNVSRYLELAGFQKQAVVFELKPTGAKD